MEDHSLDDHGVPAPLQHPLALVAEAVFLFPGPNVTDQRWREWTGIESAGDLEDFVLFDVWQNGPGRRSLWMKHEGPKQSYVLWKSAMDAAAVTLGIAPAVGGRDPFSKPWVKRESGGLSTRNDVEGNVWIEVSGGLLLDLEGKTASVSCLGIVGSSSELQHSCLATTLVRLELPGVPQQGLAQDAGCGVTCLIAQIDKSWRLMKLREDADVRLNGSHVFSLYEGLPLLHNDVIEVGRHRLLFQSTGARERETLLLKRFDPFLLRSVLITGCALHTTPTSAELLEKVQALDARYGSDLNRQKYAAATGQLFAAFAETTATRPPFEDSVNFAQLLEGAWLVYAKQAPSADPWEAAFESSALFFVLAMCRGLEAELGALAAGLAPALEVQRGSGRAAISARGQRHAFSAECVRIRIRRDEAAAAARLGPLVDGQQDLILPHSDISLSRKPGACIVIEKSGQPLRWHLLPPKEALGVVFINGVPLDATQRTPLFSRVVVRIGVTELEFDDEGEGAALSKAIWSAQETALMASLADLGEFLKGAQPCSDLVVGGGGKERRSAVLKVLISAPLNSDYYEDGRIFDKMEDEKRSRAASMLTQYCCVVEGRASAEDVAKAVSNLGQAVGSLHSVCCVEEAEALHVEKFAGTLKGPVTWISELYNRCPDLRLLDEEEMKDRTDSNKLDGSRGALKRRLAQMDDLLKRLPNTERSSRICQDLQSIWRSSFTHGNYSGLDDLRLWEQHACVELCCLPLAQEADLALFDKRCILAQLRERLDKGSKLLESLSDDSALGDKLCAYRRQLDEQRRACTFRVEADHFLALPLPAKSVYYKEKRVGFASVSAHYSSAEWVLVDDASARGAFDCVIDPSADLFDGVPDVPTLGADNCGEFGLSSAVSVSVVRLCTACQDAHLVARALGEALPLHPVVGVVPERRVALPPPLRQSESSDSSIAPKLVRLAKDSALEDEQFVRLALRMWRNIQAHKSVWLVKDDGFVRAMVGAVGTLILQLFQSKRAVLLRKFQEIRLESTWGQ